MEYLGHLVNWLQASAALIILGTMVVCLLSNEGGADSIKAWRQRCLNVSIFLAIFLFVTGLFLPSFQAFTIEGKTSAAFNPEVLKLVIFSTRFGSVWMIQQGLAILILLSLLFHKPFIKGIGYKRFLIWMIIITILMLLSGSFKSHAASLEPMWPGLLGNSLHVIAAGCWLGGLPALIFLFRSSRQETDQSSNFIIESTMRRFSVLATAMVGVIFISGFVIGYLQVSRWGELFSTTYGLFLISKIALFFMMLSVAAFIRFRHMPQFDSDKSSSVINLAISKLIAFETTLGFSLLALASILKNTTPASHEEVIIWPFNFRFSLEATWDESSDVRMRVTIGLFLIAAAIALAVYLFRKRNNIKQAIMVGAGLAVVGLIVSLPPLAVEAYPDTYRNSTVPYIAVSIKNGEDLFNENCTACHGEGGKGDGVLAKSLSAEPANLTEPHTALHTVGDMYWWLTHGIGDDRAMPSFVETFDEDEMWDLINYLRAFSEGYSGRIVDTSIDPEQPFLGAPDFYYSTATSSGNLKDLREINATLLVFFSWPESKARLDILKNNHEQITGNQTKIITIAMNGADEMSEKNIAQYPFVVITEETQPISNTYLQFRRTMENTGDFGDQGMPKHIEYTIDRFGYFRSRWIPEQSPGTWDDLDFLTQQLSALSQEDEILPPPDEHLH